MKIISKKIITAIFLCLSMIGYADDTDIIDHEVPIDSNVLFVMDMSNSMRFELASDNYAIAPVKSRKEVLYLAFKQVLFDLKDVDINVGFSAFSGGGSSSVARGPAYPVSPISANASTVLSSNPNLLYPSYLPSAGADKTWEYLGDTVPSDAVSPYAWYPYAQTPIVDALYEAAVYFRGEGVKWGRQVPSDVRSAHPSSYTGSLTYVDSAARVCGSPVDCSTGPSCGGAAPASCTSLPPPAGTEIIQIGSQSCSDEPVNCIDAACKANILSVGGSCSAIPTTTQAFCSSGVASCGNGGLCPLVHYDTHYCSDASAALCLASHPTWSSCAADNVPATADTPAINRFECEEKRNKCDFDTYSCLRPKWKHVTCDFTKVLTGNPVYDSPITNQCANNSIVLLSDGAPSVNQSAALIENLIPAAYHNNCDTGSNDERCGRELVSYLANEDQNTGLTQKQAVKTHTIGLALAGNPTAVTFLTDLASNGGGSFVNASTPAGLAAALKNAILKVSKARSFSTPETKGSGESLIHGSNVYLPVFDRGIGPLWSGNLKKYARKGGKLVDVATPAIAATDNLGVLKDTARDQWATIASVDAVKSGGVANKLNPALRIILTDNGASLIPLNHTLNKGLFNASTNSYRDKLVSFIKGWKDDGVTPRHHLGDIIHSKPIHLSYGARDVIFVGTNEGYLHAFDESTGEELFAYMPRELLKNIGTQYQNDASEAHPYGVDGPITLWHDDTDNDNIVDSGESVILYFGLRRGGKSYYALDVSNRTSPVLEWKIDTSDAGFGNLGFTWSKPVFAKIKSGANLVPVLVFGGGYIDDNDVLGGGVQTDNGSTATGAGVYIVNATNGSLLWSTSSPNYAVPASVNVLDVNRDGALDRLYFSDTGGNIWRADFNSSTLSDASNKVWKFASLGTAYKFFTEPDVALFKREGKYFASVSIGSGERPKPLAVSDNRFFVFFDKNILITPSALTILGLSDLVSATAGANTGALAPGKKGWYVSLDNGTDINEKVLSKSTTYQNMVLFNTLGINSISGDACNPGTVNQSNLYVLNLINGGAVLDFDGDSTNDQSVKVASGEIPGQPQIIFNSIEKNGGGACITGDCVRHREISIGKSHSITLDPDAITGSTNKNVKKALKKPLRRIFWLDRK